MNVLDLPTEVAQSCLEMAIALMQTARGHDELLHMASYVHRCYVRAVAPPLSGRVHDLRWRRFIGALDVYLELCSASPPARKLEAIVEENADLLETDTALAS